MYAYVSLSLSVLHLSMHMRTDVVCMPFIVLLSFFSFPSRWFSSQFLLLFPFVWVESSKQQHNWDLLLCSCLLTIDRSIDQSQCSTNSLSWLNREKRNRHLIINKHLLQRLHRERNFPANDVIHSLKFNEKNWLNLFDWLFQSVWVIDSW